MRTFAYLICLTLGAAAQAGIAGLAAAAVLDLGSALVIAMVVALGVLVIGLLEWSHRRGSGLGHRGHGADLGVSAGQEHLRDRDTLRALDEIRAARAYQAGAAHLYSAGIPTAGTAYGAVSHVLRSV
jgi:hypothetical protein